MSPRRPDLPDGLLGARPAREAEVGAEHWTSLDHERLVKLLAHVDLIIHCFFGSAGDVADTRDESRLGRDERKRETTTVARPRLLLTLFRVSCSCLCACVACLDNVVFHACGPSRGVFCFLFLVNLVARVRGFALVALSDYSCLSTSAGLTIVIELPAVRFRIPARVNERVSTPI